MSDLISRKAILEHIEKIRQDVQMMDDTRRASIVMNGMYLCEKAVRNQPSAQPERKKGFWYALEKGDKGYSAGDFKCSVCGEPNRCYVPKPHFCPSCGADMRGENDGE